MDGGLFRTEWPRARLADRGRTSLRSSQCQQGCWGWYGFTFLWEKGQLDIDRPVTDFLAESDYPDITIRQLLTHSTDLDPFIPNRDLLAASELKDAMFHLNRRSQSAFLYSDVHFLLLGFILERILIKTWMWFYKNKCGILGEWRKPSLVLLNLLFQQLEV